MPDTHQDELPLPLDPLPPPPLEDPLPQNLDDEGEGPRNLDDDFEHVNLDGNLDSDRYKVVNFVDGHAVHGNSR